VRMTTAQEEHGQEKRLVRIHFQVLPSGYLKAAWLLGLALALVSAMTLAWPAAAAGALLVGIGGIGYWRGLRKAATIIVRIHSLAAGLGWLVCDNRRSSLKTSGASVSSRPTPAPNGEPLNA